MTTSGIATAPHYSGPRPHSEMTQDFTLWKHQVHHALQGLCRLALSGPAAATDRGTAFRDHMVALYRTAYFTEFITSGAWRQAGVTEHVARELRQLQQELDAFDEPDTDAEWPQSPEWASLVRQAQKVVALLH